MKKIVTFLSLLILLISTYAYAQPDSKNTDYLQIDYINIDADDSQNYLKLIQDTWKPSAKKMINSGDLKEWYLYKVIYNGGEKTNYNYVMVTKVNDLDKLKGFDSGKFLSKSNREKLNELGEEKFSEIWKVVNSTELDNISSEPARYMAMDYMNVTPGKDSEYLLLEDDIARPIQEERIELGEMVDWHVYQLLIPLGTEYGYNYATGNFYNNLSDLEFGFTNEVIIEAHPGIDIPELWNMIYTTRDMVAHELWELVDYAK